MVYAVLQLQTDRDTGVTASVRLKRNSVPPIGNLHHVVATTGGQDDVASGRCAAASRIEFRTGKGYIDSRGIVVVGIRVQVDVSAFRDDLPHCDLAAVYGEAFGREQARQDHVPVTVVAFASSVEYQIDVSSVRCRQCRV